jgi:hypothetical protein
MDPRPLSKLDRAMAYVCRNCPVCRRARRQQAGAAFWLVNRVEQRFCPFCRAYERVYGRKAHEAACMKQEGQNMESVGGLSGTERPMQRSPFQWRALTLVVVLLSFAMLASSGFVLWLAPPGRIANWGDWTLLGLRRYEWADLHVWFALVFALATLVHIVFNRRPLLGCFKSKLSCRWAFRWEWLVATALCAVVFIGVRLALRPFSSLLAYRHAVRQSWGQPGGRGYRGPAANVPGDALTNSSRRGGGPGFGLGRGRGGGGGGYGRQTLADFCAGTGVDLAVAQDRLKAKGIQASSQQTLREIAEGNGFQTPSELVRIIRGDGKLTE